MMLIKWTQRRTINSNLKVSSVSNTVDKSQVKEADEVQAEDRAQSETDGEPKGARTGRNRV